MSCEASRPVIRLENVSKYYQIYSRPSDRLKQFFTSLVSRLTNRPPRIYGSEFRALEGITLEVRAGETVGVIGRNGSGKSTLLQLICGTLAPTHGRVETHGRIAALLELGAGFDPEFTGRDNVYMYAAVLGLTEPEIDERLESILDFAEIGGFIDQPVKTYSSGMYVRLAFAVIAHVDADILVIDEALAVGDAFFVQKCMRFLRGFMKTGTVLFVSHDTTAILNLCERALWLERGELVQTGEPKAVADAYLRAFFEARQGSSSAGFEVGPARGEPRNPPEMPRDMRQDLLNYSDYRNDLEVFSFNPEADGFGSGGAMISHVMLVDENRRRLTWCIGGEEVTLEVQATIHQESMLPDMIMGFYIKDRLGQTLFGDNTFIAYRDQPVNARSSDTVTARFTFRMPILPRGDYSISAAVASGTQDDHVQHHWLHDALFFKSHSSSESHGLVGIPMHDIRMEID